MVLVGFLSVIFYYGVLWDKLVFWERLMCQSNRVGMCFDWDMIVLNWSEFDVQVVCEVDVVGNCGKCLMM